jgi:hypothetical protein
VVPNLGALLADATTLPPVAAATTTTTIRQYKEDDAMLDEAADTGQMDDLPFDTVIPDSDDDDDHDLFHDAGTWDSDAHNSKDNDLLPAGLI